MLRQFYGISIPGMDPLPEDDNGIDLALVFRTVRRSVMEKSRWDVEEIAFLGLVSFSRFFNVSFSSILSPRSMSHKKPNRRENGHCKCDNGEEEIGLVSRFDKTVNPAGKDRKTDRCAKIHDRLAVLSPKEGKDSGAAD